MIKLATFLFFLAFLGTAFSAQAQPFTLDQDLKPLQLKPVENDKFPGALVAAAQGTLQAVPQYLYANGMTPQREQAAILLVEKGAPVTLHVVKNTWDDKLKSCTARVNAPCNVQFRAFSNAGFKITGKPGAQYRFVLMQGPEAASDAVMPSPVYHASKKQLKTLAKAGSTRASSDNRQSAGKAAGGGNGFQMIVIVLLVVLIAVVLAGVIVMMRKNKNASLKGIILLAALGALLAPHPVHAQRLTPDFGDIPKDLDYMEKIYKALKAGNGLAGAWLSDCDRIGNPPNTPRIPSFCEDNAACSQCYSQARTDFNQTRATLEKLRLIYSCTKKFTKKAIAFGDDVSPATGGLGGLAWQTQRSDIERSFQGLEKAYDAKYVQLMGRLHTGMMQMDACEAQFGVPDWYDRFGFPYFEFMADKYGRPGGTTVHESQFGRPSTDSTRRGRDQGRGDTSGPAPRSPRQHDMGSGRSSGSSSGRSSGDSHSPDDKYGTDGKYNSDGTPVDPNAKYGKDPVPGTAPQPDDKYGTDGKYNSDGTPVDPNAKYGKDPVSGTDTHDGVPPVIGEPGKPYPSPKTDTKEDTPPPIIGEPSAPFPDTGPDKYKKKDSPKPKPQPGG